MIRLLTAIVALALLAGACGDGDNGVADVSRTPPAGAEPETPSPAPGTPTPAADAAIHPPNDVEALAEIYDPMLAGLGVRVTRGSIVERGEDGITPSDTGNHLQLYVRPIEDYPDHRYVSGFYDITAIVTPHVFATWSGIESYDICQEPRLEDDPRDQPPPVTQIDIFRDRATGFDWANADLAQMLALDLDPATSEGIFLRIEDSIEQSDPYQTALAEAQRMVS